LPNAFIISFILSEAVTFYPASGYRQPSSGVFIYEGERSCCWSCAITSGNGYRFYLYNTYVNPAGSEARAHGWSVRCVQHLLRCLGLLLFDMIKLG